MIVDLLLFVLLLLGLCKAIELTAALAVRVLVAIERHNTAAPYDEECERQSGSAR